MLIAILTIVSVIGLILYSTIATATFHIINNKVRTLEYHPRARYLENNAWLDTLTYFLSEVGFIIYANISTYNGKSASPEALISWMMLAPLMVILMLILSFHEPDSYEIGLGAKAALWPLLLPQQLIAWILGFSIKGPKSWGLKIANLLTDRSLNKREKIAKRELQRQQRERHILEMEKSLGIPELTQ